ncbi:MAG: hypothetical protein PHS80_07105, partial [Methanothrix sp.]|nr:hypothetical protein [Methanothrix sp.]
NLTAWAIGSLANLVIFAGFIIIIGTILGVIIDGIHHSFIEDDIFDNFKAVYILKMPIKRILKARNYDNFTRHFFFPKMGDKGAKAIELEDHFDQAYYRYSEFYSNIFISLIIFSIISPFYIFEVLELTWEISIGIGIASLLIACICLICSYTSYKTYLKAQSSAICGFIKESESESILTSEIEPINCYKYNIFRFLIFIGSLIPASIILIYLNIYLENIIVSKFAGEIIIAVFIILLIDWIYLSKNVFQNNNKLSGIEIIEENKPFEIGEKVKKFLNSLLDEYLIVKAKDQTKNIDELMKEFKKSKEDLDKLRNEKKELANELEALKNIQSGFNKISGEIYEQLKSIIKKLKQIDLSNELSKSSSAALFSFISSLLLCMIILSAAYTPINLNVETTSIKLSENITDKAKIKNPVETLSIKNLGKELNLVNLNISGIESNWLEISYVNDKGYLVKKSNNITINKIASDETKFVQLKLNSSAMDIGNTSPGSYIGSIDIKYKNNEKSVPLSINLTKK